MSRAQYPREDAAHAVSGRALDADLRFLSRWASPLGLLGRAMLAYIFIVEGMGKVASYAGVAGYMQAHGVDGRLLPLVILTELGGGLLVLVGLKTRWAAIALFGFCLMTALFFHLGADQTVELQKNIAMAGGFLTLAIYGPGDWSSTAGEGAPDRAPRGAGRSASQAQGDGRGGLFTSARSARAAKPARSPCE